MTATVPSPAPPLRVLIVDDHPVVAEGWEWITRGRLDCEVIAAATPSQGWRAWRRQAPDVIVVDLTMGEARLAGARLIERLRAAGANQPILVFTMHRSPIIARRALQAGCNGIIMKDSPSDDICEALREVARGGDYVPADLARRIALLERPGATPPRPRLTPRELDILRAIAEGLSYREIAERANISYKTVSNVSQTLKDKLSAQSFADLVVKAIRHLEETRDGI
ncbi:response regulator transcription factor [Paracoccus denitrificans]|jgi:two-component system uhpT operon response regulator UhpA|uniref:Two component transcriptional regulator, LuxR family n=1 Tax=Paracoccus denitrificans (strain Pd 1222) TaxID=318586 RepID=A1B2Y7_PARDP|nr:response regulator transcription factor [Paracoccus denitrificans]ABL69881.1 two component transcriptional regulator, LuxR family [Paracoccus denitrificans PD1222]MBB4626962.1 two-component system uhpT operon response regulator UhpA [Paracoccus denitrificans]MCU7428348.1 response regulator transcription factor [Paracoccus denitrificans]QAR25273.1 response regulator transcription factor [Paracoccus denitrificans]UPV94156.1 response regulator transcription factor [Paracoccus denitrificans]